MKEQILKMDGGMKIERCLYSNSHACEEFWWHAAESAESFFSIMSLSRHGNMFCAHAS